MAITVGEVKGYTRYGSTKWKRGNKLYSLGKKYISNLDYIPVIVETNLDTNEMKIAALKMQEKFFTPEYYKEWLLNCFTRLNK